MAGEMEPALAAKRPAVNMVAARAEQAGPSASGFREGLNAAFSAAVALDDSEQEQQSRQF
jgi:hypothetical protein